MGTLRESARNAKIYSARHGMTAEVLDLIRIMARLCVMVCHGLQHADFSGSWGIVGIVGIYFKAVPAKFNPILSATKPGNSTWTIGEVPPELGTYHILWRFSTCSQSGVMRSCFHRWKTRTQACIIFNRQIFAPLVHCICAKEPHMHILDWFRKDMSAYFGTSTQMSRLAITDTVTLSCPLLESRSNKYDIVTMLEIAMCSLCYWQIHYNHSHPPGSRNEGDRSYDEIAEPTSRSEIS